MRPIQLTNEPSAEVYAIWSPDGSKIVFGSNRDGNYEIYEIYVMDADGSNQTRLTNNRVSAYDEAPSWGVSHSNPSTQ